MSLFRKIQKIFVSEEEVTISSNSQQQKACLIVGANTSVGGGLCSLLAQEKHKLALACDSGLDQINEQSSELTSLGAVSVNAYQFKSGSNDSIEATVSSISNECPSIDVLAFALEEPFRGSDMGSSPLQLIQSVFDINYNTLVYFTYHMLPVLRKTRGKIIVLSSFLETGQDQADPLFYAARAATLGFFETLQEEEKEITIVIVRGHNEHPEEISISGSPRVAQPDPDLDTNKSANLVWAACR